jgi:hypothetical protein
MSVIVGVAEDSRFFSVRKAVNISGKIYRPCVCYTITSDIYRAVKSLLDAGNATVYEKKVLFVSGVAQPVKIEGDEAVITQAPVASSNVNVDNGEISGAGTNAEDATVSSNEFKE